MKFLIHSIGKNSREFVLFDDEDVMTFFNYRWYLSKSNARTLYVVARGISGKLVYMHGLLLPPKKGLVIDHINGNGLDNRKHNLRYALTSDNLRNSPPRNGKKYKGTTYRKGLSKPWSARLNTKEKSLHLGYFSSEIEAAQAYNHAALKHFKDWSWLNKIEGDEE